MFLSITNESMKITMKFMKSITLRNLKNYMMILRKILDIIMKRKTNRFQLVPNNNQISVTTSKIKSVNTLTQQM